VGGLEDCWAGLLWVHAHRAELGISTIVAAGELGGATHAIALALKAKQMGQPELVSGLQPTELVAQCIPIEGL
jgi:acetyl esterase/lipase